MNCRLLAWSALVLVLAGWLVGSSAQEKKSASPSASADFDWSSSVKFPASEKPVKLFNGKDFDGWEGNTGEGGTQKYFTIKDAGCQLACVLFASVATMRLTRAGRTASAAATASAPLVVLLYAMALAGLHQAGWMAFSLWLLVPVIGASAAASS